MKVKSLNHVRPSAIPWTAAYQAPPSMGFSRQEYWSEVPLPSPPGTNRLPIIQVTVPPPCLIFTGAELPESRKKTPKAAYFLCPWIMATLSIWSYKCRHDPSSCTNSTPGPHWGRPKSSRAHSGTNSCGQPSCRCGDKTTIEL